jgi:hypothetical protein
MGLDLCWEAALRDLQFPGSAWELDCSSCRQQSNINKNMTTLHLGNSLSCSPLRRSLLFIPLALCCFALSPALQAVTPAPDGGYPGGNTAEGTNALFSLTTGVWNTAVGFQSLYNVTTGTQNTATGYQTLFNNTTGSVSTAYGAQSLYHNTTGGGNTATGFRSLYSNTDGEENTAFGYEALAFNTSGSFNTAIGGGALYRNIGTPPIGANDNTATGYAALNHNTYGSDNTALGFSALFSNIAGDANTATGSSALVNNTTGGSNTADGDTALQFNTDGSDNTAVGCDALGYTTGSQNVALGSGAGENLTTGDENIDIGYFVLGEQGEEKTIRIGNSSGIFQQTRTFIAGINGVAVTGTAVVVNSSGQLGVASSSERFKDAIKPMDRASEAILALKPVTFRYKENIDPKGAPQFGLVAEDVEKVNPDLVSRDAEGKVFTVRYEAVNAMLLNEFLKEHRTVQELKSTAAKQEATIAKQQKQIEALTTGLQKVSDQLQVSESAPQIVVSN